MEKAEFEVWIFILLVTTAILSIATYYSGYKQGTIDALTGHAEYRLVTMPDSTRTWEKIK